MAQLNSRGTQTRNRWDFYESSDGVAHVAGSVNSGALHCYFANNSTGAAQLDIFSVSWTASSAQVWGIALNQPPLITTPLTPIESFVIPLQPDRPAPPGVVGVCTSFSNYWLTMIRYSNKAQGDTLVPVPGSYFLTLPPGWALSVGCDTGATTCELSMTVWYQEVTDNISPAR